MNAAPAEADLRANGAAVMLEALRAEHAAEHAGRGTWANWADGTVLAVARKRVTGGCWLFAEPGDLILVQRDPCREAAGTLPPRDIAWSPRAYAFTRLEPGDADDITGSRGIPLAGGFERPAAGRALLNDNRGDRSMTGTVTKAREALEAADAAHAYYQACDKWGR